LQTERERVPLMEAFQTTSAKRGLFIGLGVMLLQQFSGCNAVIFYATFIFKVKYTILVILILNELVIINFRVGNRKPAVQWNQIRPQSSLVLCRYLPPMFLH